MASEKYRRLILHPCTLDASERERCLRIPLRGIDKFVMLSLVNKYINLLPKHIDYYFGTNNVTVALSSGRTFTLDAWLDYKGDHSHKLLGFAGAEGSILYIVIKKEEILL